MRDAIARALIWVLTVLPWTRRLEPGRHSMTYLAQQPSPEPVSANPWLRPWRGPSSKEVREIFHAEEVQSLTPEQRERWWAAAFFEIGVDYDFPTNNITGAHRVAAA
ncbi:hypothetical protein [Streptomyces sp. NPDC059008]|uniref:hypothetical protein n=1 Tax=Streptomyces sp. NPDC059008 TaxID=3346693 RepID=UPI003687A7FC